jgi:hypothetical protein
MTMTRAWELSLTEAVTAFDTGAVADHPDLFAKREPVRTELR